MLRRVPMYFDDTISYSIIVRRELLAIKEFTKLKTE